MPAATGAKSRTVDLNKMRAARLEKKGKGPVVKFGKNTLQCPAEVPFMVVEAFGRMDLAQSENNGTQVAGPLLDVLKALFGLEQFELFMAENPSAEDMGDLLTAVLREYGIEEGESEASPTS
jgi:hypothetical protein